MDDTAYIGRLKVERDELVSLQTWAKKAINSGAIETQILEKVEEMLGRAEELEKECYWIDYDYSGPAAKVKGQRLKAKKYLESVLPKLKAVLTEIETLATELRKIDVQDYKFSRIISDYTRSLKNINGELNALIHMHG